MRTPVRLVAAFAVLAVAVATAVTITQRGPAQLTAAQALTVCDRDGIYDVNCVTQTIEALPVDNAGVYAAELLSVVQQHPELADACHGLMHTLGRHIADEAGILADQLTDTWEPCGYGLLHGVFEYQDIPDDATAAGAKIAKLCLIGNIPSNDRLLGECYHALGHAIYDTFGGLDAAVPVCDAAFPGDGTFDSSQRVGCYSGLAMKERDEVLKRIYEGERVEPTVAAFDAVAGACRSGGVEFAAACAPGFVQIATEFGPDHVRPFLQWCSTVTPQASVQCYQQAGVYMGHFRAKFDSLAQSVELCSPGSPDAVETCRTSLVEGLLNRGEALESALEQVCDAYQTAKLPNFSQLCSLTREKMSGR